METAFDILTVACFAGLVIAYFQFTKRDARTLKAGNPWRNLVRRRDPRSRKHPPARFGGFFVSTTLESWKLLRGSPPV